MISPGSVDDQAVRLTLVTIRGMTTTYENTPGANGGLNTSGSRLVQVSPYYGWLTNWIGSGPPPFGGVDNTTAVITYLHPVPNGQRQLRAIVTTTSVQVYDLGGAPLPPGDALAATTLPWPY